MVTTGGPNASAALVSVIIPTYNRAYCLRATVDSALQQTHRTLEVHVIDDGSTDSTAEVIASYGDRRLHYHFQPNQGVAAARNRGISAARGSHVAFLDSDDTWAPWKLQAQLACLSLAPDVGMIWTNMQAVDSADRVVSERYLTQMYDTYRWFSPGTLFDRSQGLRDAPARLPEEARTSVLYIGDIFSKMVVGNLVHTSTVLITRSRLEEVGEFDETFHVAGEDYEFHLRTCLAGPVALLDVASIRYRIGMPDQLTRRDSNIYFARNYLRAVEKTLANHPDKIDLSNRTLRRAIARGHRKAARAYLSNSRPDLARSHFRESLRHDRWQVSTSILALIAQLPTPVSGALGRGLAKVRRQFRSHGRWRSRRRGPGDGANTSRI